MGGVANLTFLHEPYRLHTASKPSFMGETNPAGAGLMIWAGREGGGISRIGLGILVGK
jgi:hypothetical protein